MTDAPVYEMRRADWVRGGGLIGEGGCSLKGQGIRGEQARYSVGGGTTPLKDADVITIRLSSTLGR